MVSNIIDGSPNTPDGIIHYTFSGANVMDGFDGRTKPGFIVTDNDASIARLRDDFSFPAEMLYFK